MPIQLYCPECKSYASLNSKKCPKCGMLFPKDGKKFRVDVSVQGKRFTRFAPNLTVAREMETTIRTEMLREEFDITAHKPKAKAVTLGDVWEKYLPWAKTNKKSWENDASYYGLHVAPRFSEKPLADITPFDLEKMRAEMKKGLNRQGKPYAAQTIKHQLVIVRRLFNLARKWGMFDGKSPIESITMPKVDNRKTEYLNGEEMDRLQAVLDSWPCLDTVAFVRFAMLTGFRRGELFKLQWDHVDFERGMVTLASPKGGKTVTLPVSEEALNILRGLPVVSSFIFPGQEGKQRTNFSGPWERIRKAAELPEHFRFHGLRHHFASSLVSSGVSLEIVKELLSHKDLGTTQRYSHLMPDTLKQAAKMSAGIIVPNKKAGVVPLPVKI